MLCGCIDRSLPRNYGRTLSLSIYIGNGWANQRRIRNRHYFKETMMKDYEYLRNYAASLHGQPKRVERLELIADRLKKLESAYCKLINCEYYQDGPNLAGVYCPSELLYEFDDLFDA